MTLHVVFCSARDGNVTLFSRSADWSRHLVLDPAPAGDVECLARGRSCSGTLCPFCAEPVSGAGLREVDRLRTVRPA